MTLQASSFKLDIFHVVYQIQAYVQLLLKCKILSLNSA
jgi:hypothetical protein